MEGLERTRARNGHKSERGFGLLMDPGLRSCDTEPGSGCSGCLGSLSVPPACDGHRRE